MLSSCRRASANLHVPVEQTPLLYKEGPEFLRPLWRQQAADAPELFRLRLGETTATLPAAEWADGVSS
jgi:hypothetical protein